MSFALYLNFPSAVYGAQNGNATKSESSSIGRPVSISKSCLSVPVPSTSSPSTSGEPSSSLTLVRLLSGICSVFCKSSFSCLSSLIVPPASSCSALVEDSISVVGSELSTSSFSLWEGVLPMSWTALGFAFAP